MVREEAPPIPECPDPACPGGPLDVWQPFEGDPEFIIGICRECRGIHRLEPEPDGAGWRVDAAARPVPAVRGAQQKPPTQRARGETINQVPGASVRRRAP
jgi:hypothetical protein